MHYDCIYYWVGGTERGHWHRVDHYHPDTMAKIQRQGYVALKGKISIGAPEGPPAPELIAARLSFH